MSSTTTDDTRGGLDTRHSRRHSQSDIFGTKSPDPGPSKRGLDTKSRPRDQLSLAHDSNPVQSSKSGGGLKVSESKKTDPFGVEDTTQPVRKKSGIRSPRRSGDDTKDRIFSDEIIKPKRAPSKVNNSSVSLGDDGGSNDLSSKRGGKAVNSNNLKNGASVDNPFNPEPYEQKKPSNRRPDKLSSQISFDGPSADAQVEPVRKKSSVNRRDKNALSENREVAKPIGRAGVRANRNKQSEDNPFAMK